MLAAERGVNLPEDGPKADQTTDVLLRVSLRLSRRRMVMQRRRGVGPMTVLCDAAVPPGDCRVRARRCCLRRSETVLPLAGLEIGRFGLPGSCATSFTIANR
jgi:hypothetical protein